jgi:D-cysteine desulfhydrase
MDLSRFPRRRYTPFATPIEPMPRFSAALAASCPGGVGPEVWIKRDDMLGLFPGGNKTRKLEFLVADALAQGADTLITCGAPQSNHCRITLAAAVKEGLQCRFVIEERVAGSYDEHGSGNHFMFRLLGVEAITVVPGGSPMAPAMQQVADELAAQGRKGYIIPGGGSNAVGGLGYVACAQETAAAVLRPGPALRPAGGGQRQLGHPRRAGGGLSGQPHRRAHRGHRRQPRPGRSAAARKTEHRPSRTPALGQRWVMVLRLV